MNLLKRVLAKKLNLRYLCSIGNHNGKSRQKLKIEKLSDRGLIRVAGKDLAPFLQGLVTNDIEHLHRGSKAIYAMFLNKGGRIMYDSIIYKTQNPDVMLIECDADIVKDLVRHLMLFRVRRKIDIAPVNSDYLAWVAHGGIANAEANGALHIPPSVRTVDTETDVILCHDPRMKYLGTRIITPSTYNVGNIEQFFPENDIELSTEEDDYVTLRYKLGVGEGIHDHPVGKALPIESNGDYLHGISFHKGCYLGQELTARTYHTGVIRKRIMPIVLCEEIEKIETERDIKTTNGASIGKLRGHRNGVGLALMRIEKLTEDTKLLVDSVECTATRPFWWPGILPKNRQEATEQVKA